MVPTTDVLIEAGLQVPLMLLFDVNGSAGATEFKQSEPNGSKVGVTFGVTVTSIVVVAVAHWPASGVKVYVVVPGVDVLITAGLQVPLMLLFDVNGNAGATEFKQSEPNGLKVGVTFAAMVISNVAVVAH